MWAKTFSSFLFDGFTFSSVEVVSGLLCELLKFEKVKKKIEIKLKILNFHLDEKKSMMALRLGN